MAKSPAIKTLANAEHALCNLHGATREDCKDLHRLVNMAAAGSLGATVGTIVGGSKGTGWGAVIGLVVGAAYPEVAEWARHQLV